MDIQLFPLQTETNAIMANFVPLNILCPIRNLLILSFRLYSYCSCQQRVGATHSQRFRWLVLLAVTGHTFQSKTKAKDETTNKRQQDLLLFDLSLEFILWILPISPAYLLLQGENILSSISSAISHATRASLDVAPYFRVASNASSIARRCGEDDDLSL
jgi:hypothetical protein